MTNVDLLHSSVVLAGLRAASQVLETTASVEP